MPTRLQIARADIFRTLDAHSSHVFRQRDLQSLLSHHRAAWRLPQSTGVRQLVDYLRKSGKLRRQEFALPHRKEVRFTWGDVPLEALLLTIKPDCHFSHYTAVQMHELTEQDPKTIYLNFEQARDVGSGGELEQGRIDTAFGRKPRMTRNVTRFADLHICLVNGKHTGYLGVETRAVKARGLDRDVAVRVTDLERTLIDIAVRPFYAGGVHEVLKAYQSAHGRASTNRLAALLAQLDYTYPYHQAIGFYLERSGAYPASAIQLFRDKFTYEFDFYLTYEMKNPRYEARWRLYVPQGF
jgi:hypothetical protein